MAEISSSPVGFWKVISDTTLTVNQTFIDFLNLDLNTDGEYILTVSFYNNNAVNSNYNLFINGDLVDANYFRTIVSNGGAGVSSNSGVFITLSLNESFSGVFHILNNPKGKPFQRCIASSAPAALNAAECLDISILCPAAANVTSMRLNSSIANALPAGSRFILSKIKS